MDGDGDDDEWICALFSHITDSKYTYACVGNMYMPQCIHYEGNEYLVGTTDKPKEE